MDRFRFVQTDGDYIDHFQCLKCKGNWTDCSYGSNYNYCPRCGVKFDGILLCRTHNVPRWVYDRFGNDGMSSEIWNRLHNTKDTREWVIEFRIKWKLETGFKNLEYGEWTNDRTYRGKECNAKNVHGGLIWSRRNFSSDDVMDVEYRVRRTNS